HPWRHDVRQTTGCIFSYAFRDLSNLRWTVEFTTDCGGHDNMNAMDAEVTHLRILANLKTREIVPQFSNSPPTGIGKSSLLMKCSAVSAEPQFNMLPVPFS